MQAIFDTKTRILMDIHGKYIASTVSRWTRSAHFGDDAVDYRPHKAKPYRESGK